MNTVKITVEIGTTYRDENEESHFKVDVGRLAEYTVFNFNNVEELLSIESHIVNITKIAYSKCCNFLSFHPELFTIKKGATDAEFKKETNTPSQS